MSPSDSSAKQIFFFIILVKFGVLEMRMMLNLLAQVIVVLKLC